MTPTKTTRLIVESGILVGLITGAGWFAVLAYKVDAQASNIETLQVEQETLAKELVQTQKQMISDLTEIKTILRGRKW